MTEFAYIAQDTAGRQVVGTLVAETKRDALNLLAGKALLAIHVDQARDQRGGRRVNLGAMYFSQMSDLLRTGVPMLKALEVLQRQAPGKHLQSLLQNLRDRLADGHSLSEAMASQAGAFDPIIIGIVQAGEEGGFLEEALRRIAILKERSEELRNRVIGALIYPLLLLVSGAVIVLGLLIFFVPTFEPMFERLTAQGQLPWATTVLLALSGFLRTYALGLGILVAAVAIAFGGALDTSRSISRVLGILARFRNLGRVVYETTSARFCRVLGTLLNNDVPLIRALKITRKAVGDNPLSTAIDVATANVAAGGHLSDHLLHCYYIPTDIAAMIAVGEQANTLDSVLLDAANILERRVSSRLDMFLKVLEPALLLCLAAVVMFLVVGLMLPIFDASGTVH